MSDLKDGYIYFWEYKKRNGSLTDIYWCKSRIAVVENGKLIDTYWCTGNNDVLSLDEVNLEYQGSLNEMKSIESYQSKYYKSEDIVDMRHPNNGSGPILLKPNAQKDAGVIRFQLNEKRENEKRNIKIAIDSLETIQCKLMLLDQDKIDEVYL